MRVMTLKAMEIMEMPLGGVHTTWLCAEVGFCTLQKDEIEMADNLFTTALTTPNASMHLQRPKALMGKACVALRREDVASAWDAFKQADEYVRTREMRHFKADVLELGVRIAMRRGDLEAANVYVKESEAGARELGARPALYRALAHKAALLRDAGDAAGAEAAANEARALIEELAVGVPEGAIRDGFLAHARGKLPSM